MKKGRRDWKEWSVMVYLAGGRDVSDEARESLLRMKQVGSTENVHVIAQFDSGSEGTFTRRYYLTPLKNALEIEGLLKQAYYEVPPSVNLFNSTVKALSNLSSQSLMKALSKRQRKSLEDKLQITEITELLKQDPNRIKSLILNCILDGDLDREDGNRGQTNAGNPQVLKDFIQWAIENYPAGKKMVIIWGHGNGLSVAWDFPVPEFDGARGVEQSGSRSLAGAPGAEQPDSLTGAELNIAFDLAQDMSEKQVGIDNNPRRIDIVGFNSCSLGTIEVYHELSGLVDYGVASEGFTPKTSWPYDKILGALDADSGMDPQTFAQVIVNEYIECYRESVEESPQVRTRGLGTASPLDLNKAGPDLAKAGPDLAKAGPDLAKAGPDLGPLAGPKRRGIDLSACNLSESKGVVAAMAELVRLLRSKLEEPQVFSALLAAQSASQSYFNQDFTDLHDFCRALRSFSSDTEIPKVCTAVMDAIEKMCPVPRNVGEEVKNSNGVSIFFPWGEWGNEDVLRKYSKLKFLEKTHWDSFLREYRKLAYEFETDPGAKKKGKAAGGK